MLVYLVAQKGARIVALADTGLVIYGRHSRYLGSRGKDGQDKAV